MTVAQIEETPEWKAKLQAEASRLTEIHQQLLADPSRKAEMFAKLMPLHTTINGRTIFFTEADRLTIVMYAFIGLSELVSASSNFSMVEIWQQCITRAIHNMKKDGLLS